MNHHSFEEGNILILAILAALTYAVLGRAHSWMRDNPLILAEIPA